MRVGRSWGVRLIVGLAAASLGVAASGGGAGRRQRIAHGDRGRERAADGAAGRRIGPAAGGSGARGDLPPRHTILIVAEVHS